MYICVLVHKSVTHLQVFLSYSQKFLHYVFMCIKYIFPFAFRLYIIFLYYIFIYAYSTLYIMRQKHSED